MSVKDLVVYAILLIVVLWVTRIYSFWGAKHGEEETKKESKRLKKEQKKRNKWMWFLRKAQNFGTMVGGGLTKFQENELRYRIDRLGLKINAIQRNIKPAELTGIFKLVAYTGVFLALLTCVLSRSPLGLLLTVLCVTDKIVIFCMDSKIHDMDMDLEMAFPNLFIMINSRLKRGAENRLAPTLDEYRVSLEDMYGDEAKGMAIYEFVQDMRNNISVYADDAMAVRKLRDRYRSAMIINFVNLAVQSLSGVDNKDKLNAFESELMTSMLDAETAKRDADLEKGNRAVYSIYIIVIEFVLLSWASKIDMSMFSAFFKSF